ncbi:MAG: hypothetical protein M1835_002306 [Candelina submexicana]|nr:MAG: hypothetical protein M1835_002306 [Candelina submexicana]
MTTFEDAEKDTFSFCKPIPKTLADRIALVQAVVDGSSKFFFGKVKSHSMHIIHSNRPRKGSDSAPHPIENKKPNKDGKRGACAAGVFSMGWTTGLVIDALEIGTCYGWITKEQTTREVVEGFLSRYGREFYRVPASSSLSGDLESRNTRIRLEREGRIIPRSIVSSDGEIEVVPFRRGEKTWSLSWI